MNAIELLESQHEEMKDLFDQIEDAEDHAEKLEIFRAIGDSLAAHATIEEKIFYPAIFTGELKDKLYEAVEEHLAAKRLIADLVAIAEPDDTFDAKVKVLQEQIDHHIEEEEGDIFPRVKESMSVEELEMYGAQMEALFQELMQEQPRKDVPNETAEAAPLPR